MTSMFAWHSGCSLWDEYYSLYVRQRDLTQSTVGAGHPRCACFMLTGSPTGS